MTVPRALVIGSGLIGTSLGLALGAMGWEVLLSDRDPAAAALAARRQRPLSFIRLGHRDVAA